MPNCYDCIHRRNVPGDSHISCAHPDSGNTKGSMFSGIIALFDGSAQTGARKLGIVAHEQGVRMGYFMWPGNFDPTWLVNCNGFTPKTVQKDA